MHDMESTGRRLDLAIAHYAAAAQRWELGSAASALGEEWGRSGIGIGAALDDLVRVHGTVLGEAPPAPLVRAFAESWADASIGVLLVRGALDQRTGLATTDYLATRLRDLARSAEASGRVLVIADCPSQAVTGVARELRMTRIAHELVESFLGAETPVGIGSSRIAIVAPRDDRIEADLARARVAVGRIAGFEHGEIGIADLPEDVAEVRRFVLAL